MSEITMATIKALRWFHARGEVGWFDASAPRHSMRNRLVKRGLIEHVPDGRPVHLKKLRITEIGLNILRESGWI